MKFVCITGYKRPEYFIRLLESLILNDLEGWKILIQIEPSEYELQFKAIAKRLLPSASYRIEVNLVRLGVRLNPFSLLNRAFRQGASTVIYLEEDILISTNVTSLANWYSENHKPSWLCMSLITGGCGSKGFISYDACERFFFQSNAFNSLGLVINHQSWKEHFVHRWLIDYPNLKDYENNSAVGWDWSIYHYLSQKTDLFCLSPATARATHIGRENGEHCTQEWHDLAFDGLPIATNINVTPLVVDTKDLPAPVRRHALMWQQMIDCMINLSGPQCALTDAKAQEFRDILRSHLSKNEYIAALNLKVIFCVINNIEHPKFNLMFDVVNKLTNSWSSEEKMNLQEYNFFFAQGGICYAFLVRDRFADYGLVGRAMVSGSTIQSLIMSSEVAGMDIELAVIAALEERLKSQGFKQIAAIIKGNVFSNNPKLYKDCGFSFEEEFWIKTI